MGRQRGHLPFEILLVCHASLREECHRVASEKLKFSIGSVAAKHRYIQITGNGVLDSAI